MEFTTTSLVGVRLIHPRVFSDSRGFFLESYSEREFSAAGIDVVFRQDNHSRSLDAGVLRGLHFQLPPHTQSKLLRVTCGAIYDVVVDLRTGSPTFGKWEGFELSAANFAMLYVPQGFAHGFCTLAPSTEVQYKVDNFYMPSHDTGIRWNDPDLGVKWPVVEPILSDKDARLPTFREFTSPF